MLEIGVGNHAVAGFGPPGKPFGQFLDEAAAAGYDHVMLLAWEAGSAVGADGEAPNSFVNLLESDLRAIARATARRGLRVSSIYPGFLPDYAREAMGDNARRLARYREIAWELGCSTMVVPGVGMPGPLEPHASKRDALERIAELMDSVSSDRPGEVFRLGVDIHYMAAAETVEDCEYLLSVSRNRSSGLCLNMGHLTSAGERGWELLERHAGRIPVVAWKDHTPKGAAEVQRPFLSVELGAGETPLGRYAKAWRQVEDSARAIHLVTVEDVPHEERAAAIGRSVQFLRKCIKTA